MASWDQVKWTQASQVAGLMKLDVAALADPDGDPESGYRSLRAGEEISSAVRYLGHALPRFEAVAWAAHLLRSWSDVADPGIPQRQALDCAMRWLDEPTDEFRRATYQAAEAAGSNSAERLLGYAVFTSGGSISEPDLPPVQAPPEVCGRLAAAAVLIGAYRTASPADALAAACDAGEKVAALGAKALSSP